MNCQARNKLLDEEFGDPAPAVSGSFLSRMLCRTVRTVWGTPVCGQSLSFKAIGDGDGWLRFATILGSLAIGIFRKPTGD